MPTDAMDAFYQPPSPRTSILSRRVAVVTGASRSIGKGIALELGAAGRRST